MNFYGTELKEQFTSGDLELVVNRTRLVNTEWMVISPFLGLIHRRKVDAGE
jgi:hypothetical protein